MKKLFLIKNPELFQGVKYLEKNKNYFVGWYFKNTNDKNSIAFIPGISINKNDKKAFIQVITDNLSYYVNYDINDFKCGSSPFYIKIGDNFFSKNTIHIDIRDDFQKLRIFGDIEYSNSKNINTNFFNLNIMGPFSYIPFMECNHAIINMRNNVNGLININNDGVIFKNGLGYIEKDWGCSFPKSYIWCERNKFENSNASFMVSIADIPFKLFHFRGFICTLIVDDKEFRFTTYNNSKIVKYDIIDNSLNIVLKKGRYYLCIESEYNNGQKLLAPIKGKMEKDIFESISSSIKITLKKGNKILFSDSSINCGLEIVCK